MGLGPHQLGGQQQFTVLGSTLGTYGGVANAQLKLYGQQDIYGNQPRGEGPRTSEELLVFMDGVQKHADTSAAQKDFAFVARSGSTPVQIRFHEGTAPADGAHVSYIVPLN
jgi:hypothetical protein